MGLALKYQNKGRQRCRREYGKSVNGLCPECDQVAKLHLHHIDGDTFNNTESNILRICQPCHSRMERSAGRIGRRSRLTISNLAKIHERDSIGGHLYSSKDLGMEFGYSANHIRSIRRGDRDPVPIELQPKAVEVPADYVPHNKVGKPRALSAEQVDEIQGVIPMGGGVDLGKGRALVLAEKFGVNVNTIYKARSGRGCYGGA